MSFLDGFIKRVEVVVGCFEDGREVGREEGVSEDRLGEMVVRAGYLGGFLREGNYKWEM